MSRMKYSDSCNNCGARVRNGDRFCGKPECKLAYARWWKRTHRGKQTEQQGVLPKEERSIYNAFVFPPKTASYVACHKCKFLSHCQKRVQYGVHVACESADSRDKQRYAVSEHREMILELLVEGMSL